VTTPPIIAEVGVNHNGDLELAKKMIDQAKEIGANAVKFQTFSAEDLVTPSAPKSVHQARGSEEHESQYDLLKRLELNKEEFKQLMEYANDIIFFSTPYDIKSVDLLEELNVPLYKIASADIVDLPLLKRAAQTGKPVILSAGMAEIEEIKEAVEVIKKQGNNQIILLHCVSNYPPLDENINLKVIKTFKNMFPDLIIGYSDHTLGKTAALGAVSFGAKVIERHFTLDKNLAGPDHKSSLEPNELKEMINNIRVLEKQLGTGQKIVPEEELEMKKIFRKSIIANQDILKDTVITEDMLALGRPGTGLKANQVNNLIGKKAKQDIKKKTLINFDIII